MNRYLVGVALLAFVLLPAASVGAQEHGITPEQMKWMPAPPALPKGAQIAVLAGDPSKEGPYVYRLKAPAGYKVPPHTHPQDENATVISGTFKLGMGATMEEKNTQTLKAGGFFNMPKGMQHSGMFAEETIVQFHGIGPQNIIYVNPADDPRKSN